MVFVIVHDRRDTSLAERPLNALRDKLLSHRVDSKLFLTDGPWNAKLRCPVDVLTLGSGIHRVDVDRSHGRPRTSSTGTMVQSSCRYAGAAPWTHFYTSRALLKVNGEDRMLYFHYYYSLFL